VLGPGYCAAGGYESFVPAHSEFGQNAAIVATESRGHWSRFSALQLPADATSDNVTDQVTGISCPADGECFAVGDYIATVGLGTQELGFIAKESAGKWAQAVAVTPPASETAFTVTLDSVSCASRAFCVASGAIYTDTITTPSPGPLMMTLSAGKWQPGPAPATPAGPTSVAVSCRARGACVAVGALDYSPDSVSSVGWIESKGHWGRPVTLQAPTGGSADLATSISCSAVGSCVAVGSFLPGVAPMQIVLASGHWRREVALGGHGQPRPRFGDVSCTRWLCVAVGTNGKNLSYALTERHGKELGNAVLIGLPSNATRNKTRQQAFTQAVACLRKGLCTAVGYYQTRAYASAAFVATS